MTFASGATLSPGAEIYTSDDQKIGEVKETQEDAFKVNAPLELDYWLPMSSVASIDAGRVVLDFPWDLLGTHKMADPEDKAGTAAAEDGDSR